MATSSPSTDPKTFPNTKWTLVVQARGVDATDAWADIFSQYSYPLYAYARRRGYSKHDAEDITQGFFYELISKDCLASANQERGRLRSFLLTMLKNYMASEWKRTQAAKRGGGQQIVSLDVNMAEQKIESSPVGKELTPDQDYDRKWALTLFNETLGEMVADIEQKYGKPMAKAIRPYLIHQSERVDYKALQEELGIQDSNLRIFIHRRRKGLREALRQRVAETLMSEDEVEDEFRYVISLLGAV